MRLKYTAKNNPRVIIIQKLYSFLYNNDDKIEFPKHRFKKFIKDIVLGTIERNEIIIEELDKNLGVDFNLFKLDKTFQIILKSATYEILYKPNVSIKIIIKDLKINKMILITKTPKKVVGLEGFNIKILKQELI